MVLGEQRGAGWADEVSSTVTEPADGDPPTLAQGRDNGRLRPLLREGGLIRYGQDRRLGGSEGSVYDRLRFAAAEADGTQDFRAGDLGRYLGRSRAILASGHAIADHEDVPLRVGGQRQGILV